MSHEIHGYAAQALQSLSASQVGFLQRLPKAELHAHLNGSIPIHVLQELANERAAAAGQAPSGDEALAGIEQLRRGVALDKIDDFFKLFPAIYALTSDPAALARATRAVLAHFLLAPPPGGDGVHAQAAYIELRSGPRETPAMTRLEYLEAVLDEVERFAPEQAALVVSVDRRMDAAVAAECVAHAVRLRKAGRRVVGIDLCGDPKSGDIATFEPCFRIAKEAGLGVTLHIAEIAECPPSETLKLLSFKPDRLGHATFLDEQAKKIVHTEEMCVEICLSSNLLCRTVPTLDAHHIRYYLDHDHPIAICTDDILPFRNSLLGEYALLMAQPPLGLGLTEPEIEKIARMSMESRFRPSAAT